jgi:hypothetical protein
MKNAIRSGVSAAALCCLASGCGGDGAQGPSRTAHSSPYVEAGKALRVDDAMNKTLRTMVLKPASALAADGDFGRLLEKNSTALDLFSAAAAAPGDGYMFSPKKEKPDLPELLPVYGQSLSAFRLLLLRAKLAVAQGRRDDAERDLLAAMGYMAHLAEQSSDRSMAALYLVQAMKDGYPLITESLGSGAASERYTAGAAAAFARICARLDRMRAAMLEDGEAFKRTAEEGLSPASVKKALKGEPLHKRLIIPFLQNGDYRKAVAARFSEVMDARVNACIGAFGTNEPAVAANFIEAQSAELEAAASASVPRSLAGVRSRMAARAVRMLAEKAMVHYPEMVGRYHWLYSAAGTVRTALAVKAYRKANGGRLPADASGLSPAFLDRLPGDPYNAFAPFTVLKTADGFSVAGRGAVPPFLDRSARVPGKSGRRSPGRKAAAGNI